jgi:hypothetical protein
MSSVSRLKFYVSPSDAVSVFGKPAKVYHYDQGFSNKLPNGRVDDHKQSPLTYRHAVNTYFVPGYQIQPSTGIAYPSDAADDVNNLPPGWNPDSGNYDLLVNEALARFDGKLRAGHADLGVTLGSWKQSCDMIAKRAQQATRSLDRAHRRLSERLNNSNRLEAIRKVRNRHRRDSKWIGDNQYLETPANLVLEGEFGWLPLFEDAKKALTVMTKPIPNGRVTARAKGYVDSDVITQDTYNNVRDRYLGRRQVTLCANVSVESPNIWLANQLGLLNLPGVAWDLVPWSFVVNMFSNMGQIMNGFTTYYGLSLKDVSTTKSCKVIHDRWTEPWRYVNDNTRGWRSTNVLTHRKRTVGTLPRPTFAFKMPELNLELAVIAVSLAIQQVSRITRLLR